MTEIKLSENAKTVLEKRYLRKDENNKPIETIDEMFWRVANFIGNTEEEKNEFYELMTSLRFLPNSPTIMNAGTALGQLSACFVLPIEDDMTSIFNAVKNAALIHQSGGGSGFSFTRLRPKNDTVKTTGGVACFPASVRIHTDKGLLKITDVMVSGHMIKAQTHVGYRNIVNKFDNGYAEIYETQVSNGYTLRTTLNHKFLTIDDEKLVLKPLSEINVSDYVLLLAKEPNENSPAVIGLSTKISDFEEYCVDLDEDLAYLIGLTYADGNITNDGRHYAINISLNIKQQEVIDKIKKISKNKFDYEIKEYRRENINKVELRIHGKKYVKLLEDNNLLKEKCEYIQVPDKIFKSPINVVCSFLAGYFDGDGHIGKKGRISVKTISEQMTHDINVLITRLGVLSTVYIDKYIDPRGGNRKPSYRISIPTAVFKERFTRFVSPYSVKLSNYVLKSGAKNRIFSYPFNVLAKISDPKKRARISKTIIPYNSKVTTRRALKRLIEEKEIFNILEDEFEQICMLDSLYPVQIQKITLIGKEKVYNLEVEEVNMLSANGFYVSNSGPLSFMEVFNAATNTIKQGGRRRGANMGILRIDHPDIMEFITCKEDQSKLTNFNISVAATEQFMKAVEKNSEYDLINPRTHKTVAKMNAKEVFNKIVEMAWKNGEPGIVFIDRINEDNPTPELGEIESTNPCFTGDTLVAVADGRGFVSFEELAEKGEDVLVFAGSSSTNQATTRVMRNPRRTREQVPVLKITFDNDFSIRTTLDHGFYLNDNSIREASKLAVGDKLLTIHSLKEAETGTRVYDEAVFISIKSVENAGEEDVFNGTVDDLHTYFVGSGKTNAQFGFYQTAVKVENCGEQPLLGYESCNLGSINLSQHVVDGKVDWDLLEDTIRTGVGFLDNVIDKNNYILTEIEEMTKANRKIGLGIMGFADLLVKLNIKYDSKEGLQVAGEIMDFIQKTARDESVKLGQEHGNFPNFNRSIFKSKFASMRNATVTTIAPTGTISLIAGCSSGIEPYYAIAFTRNVLGGKKLFDVNTIFEQKLKERELYSEELIEKVSTSNSIQEIDEIPDELKKVFVTSHDISPEWHIDMQAEFQKYIDNATSKTINFPNSATRENISKAYQLAFQKGCKGVTVYRDGSRKYQVLTTKKQEKDKHPPATRILEKVEPRSRPEVTLGRTHKIRSGCGNLYVTVNRDETGVCEVFVQVGKSGGCITSQSEAIGRLISLSLRSGVKLEAIAEHLAGIRCPNPNFYQGKTILSCADGIAHVLENYIDGEEIVRFNGTIACPDCGGMLELSEGCFTCKSCGYSKCD